MIKILLLSITFLFAEGHESSSKSSTNKPLQEKPFFTIQPFNVSILSKGIPVMIVTVECMIETAPEKWEKMRLKVPEIYHLMLIDLNQSLNFLWTRKKPPEAMILKKRLLKIVQKKFGSDAIKDVTIPSVVVVQCEGK